MELKDYEHYIGDVSLEHGGTFYDLSEWKYGYVNALRVTDLDSGCGFNGAVMVERLTIITDNPDVIKSARECCGFETPGSLPGRTSADRKLIIADCVMHYGHYDIVSDFMGDHRLIIQTESDEWDGYNPMEFDGWKADVRLAECQDLFEYLQAEGWLSEFD